MLAQNYILFHKKIYKIMLRIANVLLYKRWKIYILRIA